MEPILPRYKGELLKVPNPPSEYDVGWGPCGPPVVVWTVLRSNEEMMELVDAKAFVDPRQKGARICAGSID